MDLVDVGGGVGRGGPRRLLLCIGSGSAEASELMRLAFNFSFPFHLAATPHPPTPHPLFFLRFLPLGRFNFLPRFRLLWLPSIPADRCTTGALKLPVMYTLFISLHKRCSLNFTRPMEEEEEEAGGRRLKVLPVSQMSQQTD